MSVLRPEVSALFRRWAETAAYVAATALAIGWLATSRVDGVVFWALVAFVCFTGALLIRSAALSALGASEGEAPGVVRIDERRIAFFGPHGGGVVALDDIFAIELWGADEAYWRYEVEWVLRWSETEAALIIPVSAIGAEGMIDAFSALPGFAPTRAIAALSLHDGETVTIWRRSGAPSAAALASASSGDYSK
ncbi:MAG: hypothetical protein AAF360_15990 [Pseudomonadota bacterium]